MPWRLAAAAAAAALALVACTSMPPAASDSARLGGRLSVQVDSDPPQRQSAGFDLSGDAQAGRLLLTTPIGTAVAEATWVDGRATMTDGHGTRHYNSLAALGQEALGEAIPMAALFDWLRGRPWPGAAVDAAPEGRRGFTQLGWSIDLSGFTDQGLITARRSAPPMVTLRVRLER
ncbi:MAG: outer membrane lipoprotein LolB [Aquabacterium sp.]